MKTTFTQEKMRLDIEKFTIQTGWSVTRLARESGVEQASLSRFCKKDSGLSGTNIERLWPFLYGDKLPSTKQ